MTTYAIIKRDLRKAGRLVDEGKVAEADAVVRDLLGQGLTAVDVNTNLTKDQLAKLRAHTAGAV